LVNNLVVSFASIPIIGVIAQWFAWRLRLPAIVILLFSGFIAGPVLHFLDPDALMGEMLFPFVSLSVAIILFEGGLSLKLADLRKVGTVVRNLITVGALVTWVLIALAAHYIFELGLPISILLGSVLVVSGPTVITPMLRQLRLNKQLASVLRWEGIVIDPIGALLAVLVFETVFVAGLDEAFFVTGWVLARTLIFGGLLGVWGALALMVIIKRNWVPEYLQEVMTFVTVIGVFTISNIQQSESGLLAVTIMGIILANQREVVIKHIVTFKENLTILLLSSLFVLLAARLRIEDMLVYMQWKTLLFLGVVIFIARPFAIFVSTIGSTFSFREKLFLSWMAPRGIVAAAIASLFAIQLEELGFAQAEQLVPLTFLVIIVTVTLYGLTSPFLARFLRVMQLRHRGVLIVGADELGRMIGRIIQEKGVPVLIIDTNKEHVVAARVEKLMVIQGSVLSARVQEEIELGGFSRLLAITPSDEVNLLATIEYSSIFGRSSIFRLYPRSKSVAGHSITSDFRQGLFLFGKGMTHTYLSARITAGAELASAVIGKTFDMADFVRDNPKAIPLFFITPRGRLLVFSDGKPRVTSEDNTLIFMT